MLDFNFWTILFSIINILVLYLFLKKFLFGKIRDILEQRAAMVEADLSHAKQEAQQAEKLRASYEETMANAQDEAREILATAQKTAHAQSAAITQQAQEEAKRIVEHAQSEMALERERSLQDAKSEIALLALDAAAKVIGKDMDADANRALVDAFLTEEADEV